MSLKAVKRASEATRVGLKAHKIRWLTFYVLRFRGFQEKGRGASEVEDKWVRTEGPSRRLGALIGPEREGVTSLYAFLLSYIINEQNVWVSEII